VPDVLHLAATPKPALGKNASLNGRRPFPAANAWNSRIDKAARDPHSSTLIASIGVADHLHPDYWKLYELYAAYPKSGGKRWTAGTGAVFDLSTGTCGSG
jgi:hypothetical protein